ncbi:MAG: hypothetical protein ACAI25_03610 [Planctomycetota bacterium]
MRSLLALAFIFATACSSTPASPAAPAPEPLVDLGAVTQLVSLDATDELSLPEEVARAIADARARIPDRVDRKTVRALEDLESRYERLEAQHEAPGMERERGRVLGAYYWDRLRVFAPDLSEEPPEEILSAFERATGRGD